MLKYELIIIIIMEFLFTDVVTLLVPVTLYNIIILSYHPIILVFRMICLNIPCLEVNLHKYNLNKNTKQ